MGLGRWINRLLRPLGVRLHRAVRPGRRRFSRQSEDRILEELIGETDPTPFFVDVGAGDGVKDSNTLALALDGWPGVCFEADGRALAALAEVHAGRPGVLVCGAAVRPTDAAAHLRAHGVPREPGVVSLDIDSFDYEVLEAILAELRPTIVVAEINEKIPPPIEFAVLHHPDHRWTGDHFYGMSVTSLHRLATQAGYRVVELEYNNAFLVAAERTTRPGLTAEVAFEGGYRARDDRLERFPWNRDVDRLARLPPGEALEDIRRLFAGQATPYVLRLGGAAGARGGDVRGAGDAGAPEPPPGARASDPVRPHRHG